MDLQCYWLILKPEAAKVALKYNAYIISNIIVLILENLTKTLLPVHMWK